jgi:hypothetical protein
MESAAFKSGTVAGRVSVTVIIVSFWASWLKTILERRSEKTNIRNLKANFVCAKITQNVQMRNFA